MNKKTSNTLLHELLQTRKLPPATYTVEEISGGLFKCKVQAAGETGEGISTSKKLAKHAGCTVVLQNLLKSPTCSKKVKQKTVALQKVQTKTEVLTVDPLTKTKKPKSKITQNSSPNYVCELNEYASKRHVPFPVYDCLLSPSKTGDFIINCSFMENQTLGKGKSKKEAKQDSAKIMFKLYLEDHTNKNVKCDVTSSKKQKVEQKQIVSADSLNEDTQKVITAISKLKMIQNQDHESEKDRPIQIVINLKNYERI